MSFRSASVTSGRTSISIDAGKASAGSAASSDFAPSSCCPNSLRAWPLETYFTCVTMGRRARAALKLSTSCCVAESLR